MDIIANNRIIADFMGGKPSHPIAQNDDYWLPIHGIVNCKTIELGKGKIMKYHKSWDWLMPVVEKINVMDDFNYTVEIMYHYTAITGNRMGCGVIVDCDGDTMFDGLYRAIVKFIKWYNKKSSE